jgi:hypothetical protein
MYRGAIGIGSPYAPKDTPVKFTLPDQLPVTAAELEQLAAAAKAEINVYQARAAAGDEFSDEDVERLEYLNASHTTVKAAITDAAGAEQSHADRVNAALAGADAATATPAEPEVTPDAEAGDGDAAADVVAEAEQVAADAADPATVTAAAVTFAGAVVTSDIPTGTPAGGKPEVWSLVASAPNYAEFNGQMVDTAVIAAGISAQSGEFTGIRPSGPTILAKMARPELPVHKTYEEFYADLDRITSEIPGYGQVSAKTLVAAGGWCSPSEQMYDFCPTQPAIGLLSFPEKRLNRGGVRFPAEPDFSALQTGFHFTETELEADSGSPNFTPTAIKNFVEVPCPETMVEYRLEAIGWAIKSGILQKRAWPELIKKFLDEFMVEHQYRISAKSLLKVIAQSSAAKVVPTDAVLGATTGILNGLHIRARNLQIKTRKTTIEGVAPIWFRDVLRADLAGRDGLDVLNVTDAQVDAWLAARGIYLQYEGRWQSLGAGQPGHEDTSWWPGSVDVVLYPAGTFWRALDNVITLGVQYPIEMLQQNRQMEGFVEDEFQVGKRCDPSHLIRIPLCVNGAVGAREVIDCTTEYATTVTVTLTVTGIPTGGSFPLAFSGKGGKSATIVFNSTNAQAKTALGGMDDDIAAAAFTVVGGALPGTALVITYPAILGTASATGTGLTGGTSPAAAVT